MDQDARRRVIADNGYVLFNRDNTCAVARAKDRNVSVNLVPCFHDAQNAEGPASRQGLHQ